MKALLKQVIPYSWRARLRETQRAVQHASLPLRHVSDFGELRRLTPVANDFGQSRGTPVDRYYIEQFLLANSEHVRCRVLEVQADTYTRQFGGDRVAHADVLDINAENPRATVLGDLAVAGSLPTAAFDCIICTQTLLLIYDVRAAVANMHAALKSGGIVLATVPGVAHKLASREPSGDFWRFTSHSAHRLFAEEFGAPNVQVRTFGNVLAATAFLHGLATEELTPEELDFHDPDYEVTIAVRAVKR